MINDQYFENIEKLNGLLEGLDLSNVTSENNQNQELPDGYYLCEVENAELTSSKSKGDPMASIRFKVVENGYKADQDEYGKFKIYEIDHTKNRKIFKYYPFPTVDKYKDFVGEMMRFEEDVETQEVLKSAFSTAELMVEAMETFIGRRIYVKIETKEYNGNKNSFSNLVTWKRAKALGLPTE